MSSLIGDALKAMNDRELLHCPFCGGEASTFHIPENTEAEMKAHPKWAWKNPGMWLVGCDTYPCIGNINNCSVVFLDQRQAIEAWNRREFYVFTSLPNQPQS